MIICVAAMLSCTGSVYSSISAKMNEIQLKQDSGNHIPYMLFSNYTDVIYNS